MQRVTKDKCIDIINKFEPSKDGRKKGQLGIDGKNIWKMSFLSLELMNKNVKTEILRNEIKCT